jgi:hypothetical protein
VEVRPPSRQARDAKQHGDGDGQGSDGQQQLAVVPRETSYTTQD